MWDQKDVDLIANYFEALAPVSTEQRARLMVAIAERCMIDHNDLVKAIDWAKNKKRQEIYDRYLGGI